VSTRQGGRWPQVATDGTHGKGKAILRRYARARLTIRGTLKDAPGKTTMVKKAVTLKRKRR
jgi:hypothetical protein